MMCLNEGQSLKDRSLQKEKLRHRTTECKKGNNNKYNYTFYSRFRGRLQLKYNAGN